MAGLDFLSALSGAATGFTQKRKEDKQQEDLLTRMAEQARLTDKNNRRAFNRERKLQDNKEIQDGVFEAQKAIAGQDPTTRMKGGFLDPKLNLRDDQTAQLHAAATVRDAEARNNFLGAIASSEGTLGAANTQGPVDVDFGSADLPAPDGAGPSRATGAPTSLKDLKTQSLRLGGEVAGKEQREKDATARLSKQRADATTAQAEAAQEENKLRRRDTQNKLLAEQREVVQAGQARVNALQKEIITDPIMRNIQAELVDSQNPDKPKGFGLKQIEQQEAEFKRAKSDLSRDIEKMSRQADIQTRVALDEDSLKLFEGVKGLGNDPMIAAEIFLKLRREGGAQQANALRLAFEDESIDISPYLPNG